MGVPAKDFLNSLNSKNALSSFGVSTLANASFSLNLFLCLNLHSVYGNYLLSSKVKLNLGDTYRRMKRLRKGGEISIGRY